jgi:hypothetical protein
LNFDGDERRPILYKYYGSKDLRRSCVISADHIEGFDFASVPVLITQRVATRPLLLLGYCWTDPELRHLRRTLLKNLVGNDVDRIAVHYPLPGEGDAALYQVERALSTKLVKLWRKLTVEPVETDGATMLREITKQIEAG